MIEEKVLESVHVLRSSHFANKWDTLLSYWIMSASNLKQNSSIYSSFHAQTYSNYLTQQREAEIHENFPPVASLSLSIPLANLSTTGEVTGSAIQNGR